MKETKAKLVIQKIGKVSTQSVQKGTGRNWDEWIALLDKAGGRTFTHQELVKFLKQKHKLSMWWQQGVALHYTYHTGQRIIGQNLKGQYTTSISRTIPLARREFWRWLVSEEGQQIWLDPLTPFNVAKGEEFEIAGGVFGTIRTLKSPERIRMSWQDTEWPKSTTLQVFIIDRKGDKCVFGVSHEGIASARIKETLKEHWREKMNQVSAHFREHANKRKPKTSDRG